ncbi:DUF222 domain-containing protein [Knoellia koreensis]|uniref:DUF222 domain-containing protein n=1 Tax=Knoellia koreensis TaxID=2730921 RepID=A0A849HHU8_9MICO|nr:DUF222 domain-containing protein [Knoellia sp. DB2414S]
MAIAAALPTTPQSTSQRLLPAAGIRSVHEVLDRLDAGPLDAPGGVSPKLAARLLGELDRAVGRLQGLRLSVVAAADRAQAGAPDGFSGTGAWLAATTHTDSGQAAREVTLASDLSDGGLDVTRDAVTAGHVSQDKAGIIAHAIKQLPTGLSPASRQKAEAELVQVARSADQRVLRKAGRQVLRLAQDEVDERAARDHEATVLGQEERSAYARCGSRCSTTATARRAVRSRCRHRRPRFSRTQCSRWPHPGGARNASATGHPQSQPCVARWARARSARAR